MRVSASQFWEALGKSAILVTLVSFLALVASLISSNPGAAMDWVNNHGLIVLSGSLFLIFGVLWLVTWFRVQRERLENYRKEREKITDEYNENVRELLLKSVQDMGKMLEEGNAKRVNEIDRTLRDIGVCFAATVPYLNDLVTQRELTFLPDKWRVQIRDAPEAPKE